jgi:hypothetical protein
MTVKSFIVQAPEVQKPKQLLGYLTLYIPLHAKTCLYVNFIAVVEFIWTTTKKLRNKSLKVTKNPTI